MKTISIASEEHLLQKLRNGDEESFKRLYDLYARRLTIKLIYLLQSEDLAEDVLQDIFVKIWEIRETIDPERSFGALLHKMASNFSKNIFRRNLYDQAMRLQSNKDQFYNPLEDADNESEAKALLEMALSKLTPRQREIYLLHKLEGRSYQEISELLQISNSAINHHIQQANKQLKAILKSDFIILIVLIPILL